MHMEKQMKEKIEQSVTVADYKRTAFDQVREKKGQRNIGMDLHSVEMRFFFVVSKNFVSFERCQ